MSKCWETYVGQQFYRLIVVDCIAQIAMLFFNILVYMLIKAFGISENNFLSPKFDLESKFFELLNAQNIFWIGIYFSPFLGLFAPIFYSLKLFINLVIF